MEILGRGGTHYTFAIRGNYLATPLAFWLFAPL
ncbi:MAG: hypothetical protein WBN08_10870 [Thiogranum sp.]